MPARSQGLPYVPKLYTTLLIYVAVQVALISFLSSYYNVGVRNITSWAVDTLDEFDYTRDKLDLVRDFIQDAKERVKIPKKKATQDDIKTIDGEVNVDGEMQVLTPEQLALFDGTRDSRSIYLAILGRIYNVDKGKKHYGKGGGYHFFSGRDATRAFVSGDFTDAGLIDDTEGLSHDDLLGIRDWVSFYEKDYILVGVVIGRYYDAKGKPTEELQQVLSRIETAVEFRKSKAAEAEVFPPCNSEWHQKSGGRVWCTTKSGGVHREWSGVPRMLKDVSTGSNRCVCVKNFGPSLSNAVPVGTNRGDLDHPHLTEYDNCKPTSNSCKVESEYSNEALTTDFIFFKCFFFRKLLTYLFGEQFLFHESQFLVLMEFMLLLYKCFKCYPIIEK